MDHIEEPTDPTEPDGAGTERTVRVAFRYGDGSPMAAAEWAAAFGDRGLSGRADGQGAATIAVPAEHKGPFRLFLRSFPERYVDGEAQP
jgi:hypothetical protein